MSTDMTAHEHDNAMPGAVTAELPRRLFRPPADIRQTDTSVLIDLDMPGVDPEHVDVTLENRVLTIRGGVRDTSRKGWALVVREYGEGDYQRVFTLSEDVDADRIKAACRNGVLHLELPRAEQSMPRRITVKKDT